MRSDLVDVEVIYVHATERAVCVRAIDDGPEIWVPKSQCEIAGNGDGILRRGHLAMMTAPERVMIEKGII